MKYHATWKVGELHLAIVQMVLTKFGGNWSIIYTINPYLPNNFHSKSPSHLLYITLCLCNLIKYFWVDTEIFLAMSL